MATTYTFRTVTGRAIDIDLASDGQAFVFGKAYVSLSLARAAVAAMVAPEASSLRSLQATAKVLR